MSDESPITEPSDGVDRYASARDLLDNCDIADIRPVHIEANLISPIPRKYSKVGIDSTLEHAAGPGVFRNRFGFKFILADDDDESVAELGFVLIVEWAVEEGYTPSAEAAEYVAKTTGHFAAYPYARELAQSTAARLGLDPLVLGILNRDETKPSAVRATHRVTDHK
ncbi:MAG: hypothetical protein WD942_04620 [Dehalococcoidia bacterium]